MALIEKTDSDFEILEQLVSKLAGITVNGEKFFADVSSCCSDAEILPGRLVSVKSPRAQIAYHGSEQRDSLDGLVCRKVNVVIHLSSRAKNSQDVQGRLSHLLYLVQKVRQTLDENPPSKSCAWADRYGHSRRLVWGKCDLSDRGDSPWVSAGVELTVNCLAE